ncbi:MAG: amidase family protein [Pseudomonadota bacterium]
MSDPTQPCDLTAGEARRLIGLKRLSPKELLKSCLDRIGAVNPAVNAVVAMDETAAYREAEIAEEAVALGEGLGLLHGLPLGIKDLQTTGGLTTTYGSLIYKDNVPDQDEDSVANLRDHGGIVLAKTNTPEFGAGANTRNRVYGATGNPFDPVKTCGGSSGGSAVALATNMMPLATGSDYGGSLRTPAAFCGIVGYRPSPGLVPGAERVVATTPFSVHGPMARTVGDLHLLLRAQLDFDKRDPFSSDDAFAVPEANVLPDLRSLRVAISPDLGTAPVDAGICKTFLERMETFSDVFGAADETAPDFAGVHDVFETLRGINFVAAHHDRLVEHRDLLGPNVIDNTERGLKYTAADVAKAMREQTGIYHRFISFFDTYDILIAPAAAVSPFPFSELAVTEINGETMPTYMRWLALTYAPTTALACAAVLPCGVDQHGLPFGIQIIGPNGADAQILAVAEAIEQVLQSQETTRRPLPDLEALKAAPALPTTG